MRCRGAKRNVELFRLRLDKGRTRAGHLTSAAGVPSDFKVPSAFGEDFSRSRDLRFPSKISSHLSISSPLPISQKIALSKSWRYLSFLKYPSRRLFLVFSCSDKFLHESLLSDPQNLVNALKSREAAAQPLTGKPGEVAPKAFHSRNQNTPKQASTL